MRTDTRNTMGAPAVLAELYGFTDWFEGVAGGVKQVTGSISDIWSDVGSIFTGDEQPQQAPIQQDYSWLIYPAMGVGMILLIKMLKK